MRRELFRFGRMELIYIYDTHEVETVGGERIGVGELDVMRNILKHTCVESFELFRQTLDIEDVTNIIQEVAELKRRIQDEHLVKKKSYDGYITCITENKYAEVLHNIRAVKGPPIYTIEFFCEDTENIDFLYEMMESPPEPVNIIVSRKEKT